MFVFSKTSAFSFLILGIFITGYSSSVVAAGSNSLEGIVESVDLEKNLVTVISQKTGRAEVYGFQGEPKIDINGRKYSNIRKLIPGQAVIVKHATSPDKKAVESTDRLVKGEILEVNMEQSTALIDPLGGGKPYEVKLPENLVISGLHKGASASDLRRGHLVTLRYSTQ